MFNTINRFAEFYNKCGLKFVIKKDILWTVYQRMIVPVGPVKFDYYVSRNDAYFLLKKFSSAVLCRSTLGFEEASCDEHDNLIWYSVICDKILDQDKFLDLRRVNSEVRRKIRKGYANFTVKRINADLLIKSGYSVYLKAFSRYKNPTSAPDNIEKFKQDCRNEIDFSDIVHHWGIFFQNELIGYAKIHLYDRVEAFVSVIYIDPSYLRLYPAAAFQYVINQYYLKELRCEYINHGFRCMSHDTAIQDVLIRNFGYRKAPCKFTLVYKRYISLLVKLSFPFRYLLSTINNDVKALYNMENLHRKQNNT